MVFITCKNNSMYNDKIQFIISRRNAKASNKSAGTPKTSVNAK